MADATQWFVAVDSDRSGRITVTELQRALQMGGLNFSLATVAAMIRMFNADKTGGLTLPEFLGLHQFLIQMHQSFYAYDRDRSGHLSRSEIFSALQHAGFALDQPSFGALFVTFDPDRSDSLGLPEFIGLTLFLRGSSAIFSAFDPQRTGRVTLDYNQFLYAAANCR